MPTRKKILRKELQAINRWSAKRKSFVWICIGEWRQNAFGNIFLIFFQRSWAETKWVLCTSEWRENRKKDEKLFGLIREEALDVANII